MTQKVLETRFTIVHRESYEDEETLLAYFEVTTLAEVIAEQRKGIEDGSTPLDELLEYSALQDLQVVIKDGGTE
jgi:hypothetical protein